MPTLVQDESGNFLIDASMVFEGAHRVAALVDGVPLKKFDDDDTVYIDVDDAIEWWQKENAEDSPLESLLTLKEKINRGEINYVEE